jgi:hypothetical protein
MAKIFDQNQPKSSLAQSLNAAFAGCDKWDVAPPKRRPIPIPEPRSNGHTPPGRYSAGAGQVSCQVSW